jgi:hypothetical protein
MFAQNEQSQATITLKAHLRGKTIPLRDLTPMPATPREKINEKKANKPKFYPPNFINYEKPEHNVGNTALPNGIDPVRQKSLINSSRTTILPKVVIEGINEATSDVGVPDTNGDVGPDHYIQIVNASWFQVFEKDGTPVTEPTTANTIWSQIGKQSFSDPVIMYDEEAGRWLLTDLANINEILYGVSETSDPMGAWYLYSLNTPGWADYPKYGITPNAYVITINEGQGTFPIYMLNRAQMLAGESSIDIQRVDLPGISGAFPTATPMDWNGNLLPQTNEIHIVRMNDDEWGNGNATDVVEVWTINLDWNDPDSTGFSSIALETADFDSDGCSVSGFGYDCIAQPETSVGIDGIMTIIMHRADYRNFGTHESCVLNFSVDAGDDVAGIRWIEIRREPGGEWTVYQEGTFTSDDGDARFLGGIAINGRGDIGLGYSVSSTEKYPSLRYTGRRSNDQLGQMTIEEYEFAIGTGSRTESARFGDYTNMAVDPIDNSFWFTSEYIKADGSFATSIVNFSVGKDTFDLTPIALIAPMSSPDLSATETVVIEIKNTGLEPATNIQVGYIFDTLFTIDTAGIDTLQPDSIYRHTFIPSVDMSENGDYQIKIFNNFAEDQNVLNDTLIVNRTNYPHIDAGITNIMGIEQQSCDSTKMITVSATNFGTDTLTSVSILVTLNNSLVDSIEWITTFAPGESHDTSLLLNDLVSGVNLITVQTTLPNGIEDEIPANNGYSAEFSAILNGTAVIFELQTDPYPEETTWQLTDENDNIVYSGGNYNDFPNTLFTEYWCLDPEKCYNFTIYDTWGDGLSDWQGVNHGNYSIKNENGDVFASIININFGDFEENQFCVDSIFCNVDADLDASPVSTTGAADGAIMVSVTSGIAPYTYSIDGGVTSQSEPLFSNLEVGLYNILVTDDNDCTWEDTVSVQLLVANSNIQGSDLDLKVFPNPSESGVFIIEMNSIEGSFESIRMQVLDTNGKPVLYQSIPQVNEGHKGFVSLRNYPSGVYYVRFMTSDYNRLVRIIKL